MILLTGKETAERTRGILQPKYQVHGYSVDLTVKQIYVMDASGRVDFGGNEYAPAGRVAVETTRRQPEDRYAWWDVARGSYVVEFNETLELADDEIALIEPHDRLQRAGASHATAFLRGRAEPIAAFLQVAVLHLEIKQNARISRLRVFRLPPKGKRTSRGSRHPAKARKP